jgi:hypothetical protein
MDIQTTLFLGDVIHKDGEMDVTWTADVTDTVILTSETLAWTYVSDLFGVGEATTSMCVVAIHEDGIAKAREDRKKNPKEK